MLEQYCDALLYYKKNFGADAYLGYTDLKDGACCGVAENLEYRTDGKCKEGKQIVRE